MRFSTMRWLHFPNSKNEMTCVWNYSTARKPYNINCGVSLRYKNIWNSVHSTQEWNSDPHHPASICKCIYSVCSRGQRTKLHSPHPLARIWLLLSPITLIAIHSISYIFFFTVKIKSLCTEYFHILLNIFTWQTGYGLPLNPGTDSWPVHPATQMVSFNSQLHA